MALLRASLLLTALICVAAETNDTLTKKTSNVTQVLATGACDVYQTRKCESISSRESSTRRQKCLLECGNSVFIDLQEKGWNFKLHQGIFSGKFEYMGIQEISLDQTHGFKSALFDYRYIVRNTRPLLIKLHDAEPDTYTLHCPVAKEHEVKFNSKKDPELIGFTVSWPIGQSEIIV